MSDYNKGREIFEAVQSKDLDKLKELLETVEKERIADVINGNNFGDIPPLHLACMWGLDDITKLLVKNKADINKEHQNHTPLTYAIQHGNPEKVKLLLENGASLDHTASNVWVPLVFACQEGNAKIVQLLIDFGSNINGPYCLHFGNDKSYTTLQCTASYYSNGAKVIKCLNENGCDVNQLSKDGLTLLMLACKSGHVESIQMLITLGANVNQRSKNGESAIHLSCHRSDNEFKKLKCLMSNGADIDLVDKAEKTILMHACDQWASYPRNIIEQLLSYNPNINTQDCKGNTAFMYAMGIPIYTLKDKFDLFLAKGADINLSNNLGETLLIKVSKQKAPEVLEILLKNQAKVNLVDNEGNSALMYAVNARHLITSQLLIKFHADLNVQNNDGKSALMVASEGADSLNYSSPAGELFLICQKEMISELLVNGADANKEDKIGRTSLMILAKYGSKESMKILYRHVDDINRGSHFGQTALMFACSTGNEEAAEFLLEENADVNKADNAGMTALMEAVTVNDIDCVQILVNKNADMNYHNNKGNTALMIACKKNHIEIVEFLCKNCASLNLRNKKDQTAMEICTNKQHTMCIHILKQHGVSTSTDHANRIAIEKFLMKTAKFINEDFILYDIGIELDITYEEIKAIRTDNSKSIVCASVEVLMLWRKRAGIENLETAKERIKRAFDEAQMAGNYDKLLKKL